jgi:GntR family transcriptional repressor for pyruvate dehydrogenase complex
MDLKFIKMVPQKSYQHVVEQIQTAIIDGELKQGDCLPSEMKLKDAFDTSRGTIREALRVLEQKGLIGIRTGVKRGAVIKAFNTEAMSDSMALLIRHGNVSLPHLAEFRKLLEGQVAQHHVARFSELMAEHQYVQKIPGKRQPGNKGA